jgi:hypothetical protein
MSGHAAQLPDNVQEVIRRQVRQRDASLRGGQVRSVLQLTDQRSAAGRADGHLSNHDDRDARPVRCNGWSSRLSFGREHVLLSVESRGLTTERVRVRPSRSPSRFRDARLRRCNLNRGVPSRLRRCRSFSSASSRRTRAWRRRDRDRLSLWSERSA